MGLFGLGKKKDDEKKVSSPMPQQITELQTAPSLPEFPTLDEEEVSEFPKYEASLADIKKEIGKSSDDEINIPIRSNSLAGKKLASFSAPVEPAHVSSSSNLSMQNAEQQPRIMPSGDKPLFVKIDAYKKAIHTLDALKSKLDDAEVILKAFEEIKAQEDEKLEAWKRDLQNVKDKLFSIDKELFEV